jgi:hypothetical protein
MTGDPSDMLARLKATLPRSWFADTTPILDGVLAGLANAWSWLHAALTYTVAQTRIATATDSFLDQIAADFFGTRLLRLPAEPDGAYRTRISRELLRERGTRHAVIQVLQDLTGRTPIVFEPSRPADTGAWGGPLGYGMAGGWGSLMLPYQCFVTAYRAQGGGIANVAGYDGPAGYGAGAIQYASLSMLTGTVTDQQINAAIARVMPVSTIAWTSISN